MLKIYDSLTEQKEIFKPIQAPKVSLYVCGITVYDYCHIGHARSMIVFDMVVRYLQELGYEVNYIRNITDIDDKIIKRAAENNETIEELTNRFIIAMHEDMAQLNLLNADREPRATQYILHMIDLIRQLVANGMAYVAVNGDVYFNVRGFKNYGQLSGRELDQLRIGVRIERNDVKRDPLDFILWKMAKPDEPKWVSPWGEGRPGWHIECSAMASHELGQPFDIHGGGVDLKFPHHENEIAQSEAAAHEKFANLWMHVGLLQVNNEKMSKSLGNYFTIRDVLAEYDVETIRYFMLATHYRSPLNYSADHLLQAQNALNRLYLSLLDFSLPSLIQKTFFLETQNENQEVYHLSQNFFTQFISMMNDDFNTSGALSILFEVAHQIQRYRSAKKMDDAFILATLLKYCGAIFGILQCEPQGFLQRGFSTEEVIVIQQLIVDREAARLEKAWKRADDIRDQLHAMNIVVEDGLAGTRWRKKVM